MDENKSVKDIRVVCGAIRRQGRVLLASRRPGDPLEGHWELPGGKVEPNEDDRSALVRELREELAVDVRVGEYIGTSVHLYDGRVRVTLVAYWCELIGGEPTPLEGQDLCWESPSSWRERKWAPADLPLLPPMERVLWGGALQDDDNE